MAYTDLDSIHSPVPGDSPPASWGAAVNANSDFLYDNRREVCTSATRPTGVEGLEIYETDTNITYTHDGTDWRERGRLAARATWTPTFTQSATITKTTTLAVYQRLGRTMVGNVILAATSAGTATNAILVGIPTGFTAAWSNAIVGSGIWNNGSVSIPILVQMQSTTVFGFLPGVTASSNFLGTAAFFYPSGAGANTSITPTIASGHSIYFQFQIETTV